MQTLHLTKKKPDILDKNIQENAFIAVCKMLESEDYIRDLVRNEIINVRTSVSRDSLTMRSRLGKHPEAYNQAGGFQAAARQYNLTHPDNRFRAGDGVPHVYTKRGVEAFKTSEELDNLDLDYTTIIQKQIIAPTALIFEAMNWREMDASGSEPRRLW